MSKGKVLIVEDQAVISTNIEIMLKHKGYEIAGVAKTGEDALKNIELSIPDLVLMDIALPGNLDGIDTTQIINKKWDIPVIYLTAHTDQEILKRAKQTEPYGYLTKDISLNDQLPIMIEFVLYKHKMIGEKRQAEDALKESEEKFRSLASSARDAIFIINSSGKVSFWNNAASRIFGYRPEEAIGTELAQLIAPDTFMARYKKGFTDFSDDGKGDFVGRMVELEVRKRDGGLFPVELSLSTVKLKDEWYASGIMRDVSQRKNTESEMERLIEEIQVSREVIQQHATELIELNQKLAKSEVELKELNASKDKFFSIIAHDLKGPFQGLLGYSEMLARDIENLSKEDIKEFATDFHTSAQQLFKLLENLLQWSRVQRGVIEYNPVTAPIKELIVLSMDLLAANASHKKITLVPEVEEGLAVYADMNMVNTIIRNLVSNALKFTGAGGMITVSAVKKDDDMVLISVADTGVGISPEDREKIFRIDSHHTTPGTNNEQGTGLGLILCKELTEKNGGEIWVESVVGKGTTFRFTIPIGNSKDYE